MATLVFTAGLIVSTATASNAKASTVFKNAAQMLDYDGDIDDNQAVADFVMGALVHQLTDWSKQWQTRVDVQAAKDNVSSDGSIRFED